MACLHVLKIMQSRPAVALDLEDGLNGLNAQSDVLAGGHGLDTMLLQLVAVLGVVVGPGRPVSLPAADALDPLGVKGQRFAGLIVLVVDIPSPVWVAGQPQTGEGVVEAEIDGPPSGPIVRVS